MSKEIKISSLNLEIGKRNIELTVEEAKKLKSALEDIFDKTVDTKIIEREIYRDWYRPYITWSTDYDNRYKYSTNSSTLCCSL